MKILAYDILKHFFYFPLKWTDISYKFSPKKNITNFHLLDLPMKWYSLGYSFMELSWVEKYWMGSLCCLRCEKSHGLAFPICETCIREPPLGVLYSSRKDLFLSNKVAPRKIGLWQIDSCLNWSTTRVWDLLSHLPHCFLCSSSWLNITCMLLTWFLNLKQRNIINVWLKLWDLRIIALLKWHWCWYVL